MVVQVKQSNEFAVKVDKLASVFGGQGVPGTDDNTNNQDGFFGQGNTSNTKMKILFENYFVLQAVIQCLIELKK